MSTKFFCFLLILALHKLAAAVIIEHVPVFFKNNALGTLGGDRFTQAMTGPYSPPVLLPLCVLFVVQFLYDVPMTTKPALKAITWYLDFTPGRGIATSQVNSDGTAEVHINAAYVGVFPAATPQALAKEIEGVLYHQMTVLWLSAPGPNGQAPSANTPPGLISGLGDYVRLKKLLVPTYWRKRGSGNAWDDGDDDTAYFLDYCAGQKSGFVALLVDKMRSLPYNVNFFALLLSQSVDQLWASYTQMYPKS